MKLGIMQPYFLPYIGYFQLINAVDKFIIYDNIKYTKKGWINRNRMLVNGTDTLFSIPLESGSDYLDVCERNLSPQFDRDKFLSKIRGSYQRAPFFQETYILVERIIRNNNINLFNFLHNSIEQVCRHLEIETEIVTSSSIPIDHNLAGQEKVISLCKATEADMYINSIGGMDLYSNEAFSSNAIALRFIKSKPIVYPQFDNLFVPWLSILDVLMFNSIEKIRQSYIHDYDLIQNV